MPQAVQIGAGNIGRGYLGQLLFEGGYRTTFVDANAVLVEALNARRSYPLRLLDNSGSETLRVSRLRALNAQDADAVTEAIRQADLVSTAVGVNILPKIASLLAQGLNARAASGAGPLNVLLCENQWHVGAMMRGLLAPYIAPSARDYFETQVGLVETVIGRMVPAPTDALRAEDPLLVAVEPYKELPIARDSLRGPTPTLPGLILAADFEAYEARKLFLHNMGHAALAYVGYLRGHEYIWQCVEDAFALSICEAALQATGAALVEKYRLPWDDVNRYTMLLIHRFANQALGDTVARVAADPLRKLRPSDRLIGAARLTEGAGLDPWFIATVIAAALRYDNSADPSAVELQQRRRQEGDAALLASLCDTPAASPLGALILRALERPQTPE